ncbi:hypothetical protein [Mycobacterium simiae]|nr:hypothetical protein [Mycobacterium simiae]
MSFGLQQRRQQELGFFNTSTGGSTLNGVSSGIGNTGVVGSAFPPFAA